MCDFILWCYEPLMLFLAGISIKNEWLMFKNNKIICLISYSTKRKGGGGEEKEIRDLSTSVNSDNLRGKKKWVLLFFLHGFILEIKEKREKKKGLEIEGSCGFYLQDHWMQMFLLRCSLIHSHLRIWEKL